MRKHAEKMRNLAEKKMNRAEIMWKRAEKMRNQTEMMWKREEKNLEIGRKKFGNW